MRIEIVPYLKDNYGYLVVCDKTNACAIVDAGEAAPILAAVAKSGLSPSVIWSTHHHPDHTGANEEVAEALKIKEIVAHTSDRGRVPGQTRELRDGEEFSFGSLAIRALHVPGHTMGAVAYFVSDGVDRAVFTGDTLFVAGCGRLFEGTPDDMFTSMRELAELPGDTRVYCGHEYTEANLRFAANVEPDNAAVSAAIALAKTKRAGGAPTVPSTIADELATNPFMRAKDAVELGQRRGRKDTFR